MNLAITKEIEKQYVEAAKFYEKDIDNSASLDSYINLAFLYWSFAFELFEFNIPNNIPENWSVIGGNRYQKILELGLNKYPNSIELIFWQKYFSHIIYGTEFSFDDCKKLIEHYRENDSDIPYFYLYLFDKKKYEGEKNKLLEQCRKIAIAKNLYIVSIIEAD